MSRGPSIAAPAHGSHARSATLRHAGALVLLVGAAAAVRWESHADLPASALGPFMAGWLLMAGWVCGQLAERFGLPRVSGYLLLGLLAGPSLASLAGIPVAILDARSLGSLTIVDDLAIALIGLVAGSEIRLSSIGSLLAPAARIMGWSAALLIPAGTLLLWLVATGGGSGAGPSGGWLFAAAASIVLVANSPAIVIAVIRELGATGPVARVALAATVLKDMVLTVAFTAMLGLAVALAPGQTSGPSAWDLLGGVTLHLIGSLAAGAMIGPMLALLAGRTTVRDDLLSLFAASVAVAAAQEFHLSVLLTALTAGVVAVNTPRLNASRVAHATDTYLTPILCIAFPMLGARLDLAAASQLLPLVIAAALLRAAGIGAACELSVTRGLPHRDHLRRHLWMAFLPQAAFALALLGDFHRECGGTPWGSRIHTLLVGVVVINAIVGPAFLRYALRRDREPSP